MDKDDIMVDLPLGKPIGVKELGIFNGISETYLSKVFTKLRKAGIVRSLPGCKSLSWLNEAVKNKLSKDMNLAIDDWFKDILILKNVYYLLSGRNFIPFV